MKRPNITPGEWTVNEAEIKFFQASNIYSEKDEVITLGCSQIKDKAEANARAIAALPKVLAALETSLAMAEAVQEVMPTDELPKAIAEIKAALIEAGYTFD